ncbi:MAG: caspase family protein, partial [bacterium]|nr:caspase family protein [bacterium]
MTDTAFAERDRLHALVIGIDDYPYVHANPLRGCRNDAERMAGLLDAGFGFQVRRLLDREATRSGILEAMEDLLRAAEQGDRVVVHFSGHGSRIECGDGSFVETLVPHDSGRGEYDNHDITDQELYDWLRRLSRAYVTLIFDSCHAGGIVREFEAPVREVEPDQRPEALADKKAFVAPAARSTRDPGSSGWLPLADRYTLIAACRAHERARELDDPITGRPHGAFTCYLAEELAGATGRVSYRDVFERVSIRINTRFQEQNPQLEGAWDRDLFGTRKLVPMRFVPVRSRREGRVELGGGTAHGLVLGSEWQVYPSGTHRIEEAGTLGRLRVDEVHAVRAEAELTEELAPGAVEAGARAVEVDRPPELRRLTVWLPGKKKEKGTGKEKEIAALAQRIDNSLLLDLATDGGPWDFAVHRLARRSQGDDKAPVSQLGALDTAMWAATAGSGRLVMPPKRVSSPAAVDQVVSNLEALARHRALAELRHPDPEHALNDALEIELLRRRRDGDWLPVEPEPQGSMVCQEGDFLGIRLRHRHDAPLHVAVLDLGFTGRISLLYPARGGFKPLPPGLNLKIGLDKDEEFELYVPEELPYPGESFEHGLETLVFLATTEEADFGLLVQEGVRGTGSPLATLLHLAFNDMPKRDASKPLPPFSISAAATASSRSWPSSSSLAALRSAAPSATWASFRSFA